MPLGGSGHAGHIHRFRGRDGCPGCGRGGPRHARLQHLSHGLDLGALGIDDLLREADGIFASNQTASEGLLLALRQRNLAGKVKFVGFDSSTMLVDGLKKGEIDALVLQNPVKMGYTAVKLMADHLYKRPIEPHVDTGAALATKETMDSPEIAALLK